MYVTHEHRVNKCRPPYRTGTVDLVDSTEQGKLVRTIAKSFFFTYIHIHSKPEIKINRSDVLTTTSSCKKLNFCG